MGRHRRKKKTTWWWFLILSLTLGLFVVTMVLVEQNHSKHKHEEPPHPPILLKEVRKPPKTLNKQTLEPSHSSEEAPCPVGWRLDEQFAHCTRDVRGIVEDMIDPLADPCTQPYRHACGAFIDDPRNQGENLLFYSIYQRNREIMQDIVLKHASEQQGEVGRFFHSCVDYLEQPNETQAPSFRELYHLVGALERYENLPHVMGVLSRYDIPLPIAISMEIDPLQGSSLIPLFSQHLGVFANNEKELDSVGHLADIQKSTGSSLKNARQIVALERSLLNIRDELPSSIPFHEYATTRYNQTHLVRDWQQFEQTMKGKGFSVESMIRALWPQVEEIDRAWVYSPFYMYRFAELYRSHSLECWRVYLRYAIHIALERGPRTDPGHHYAYHRSYDGRWALPWNRPHHFYMVSSGDKDSAEQQCVYATEAYLPLLLDDYYLHGALDQQRSQKAKQLVDNIMETYQELLANRSTTLFSPHLPREIARDKLSHTQVILGAPTHWKELLQFPDRPVMGGDFLENVMSVRKYHKQHLGGLFADHPYQVIEADLLFDGLLHVDNAFYMHQLNAIIINAGILQEPLFSPEDEMEVQYGRLGVTIAHELSHAIDRVGTHFDFRGSVVNPSWMDREAFDRDTHYLVDLYTRFSYLRNLNDGQRTLDENIADQYGLHVAWRSLLRVKPSASFERFRLAFAQMYCDVVEKSVERKFAQRATHSINSVRVNAGLSTFPCA